MGEQPDDEFLLVVDHGEAQLVGVTFLDIDAIPLESTESSAEFAR